MPGRVCGIQAFRSKRPPIVPSRLAPLDSLPVDAPRRDGLLFALRAATAGLLGLATLTGLRPYRSPSISCPLRIGCLPGPRRAENLGIYLTAATLFQLYNKVTAPGGRCRTSRDHFVVRVAVAWLDAWLTGAGHERRARVQDSVLRRNSATSDPGRPAGAFGLHWLAIGTGWRWWILARQFCAHLSSELHLRRF